MNTQANQTPIFGMYLRYSSDELQNDKSIEDQQVECLEYIDKAGGYIHDDHIFFDEGESGASAFRKYYQKMLKAIMNGEFQFLIAESIDRLSRNQGDLAKLHELCQFHGVKIITLSEGDNIDEMFIAVKGMQSAFFLKDLSYKTKRGLRGRVRDGKNAGSCPYGYRPSYEIDPLTNKKVTGILNKVDHECAVVVDIFVWYIEGMSPGSIAKRLNDKGIPGPGGRPWRISTIRTILGNETYAGRRTWGKTRNVKDPSTGNIISRKNPESEWLVYEDEALRVIGDNVWQAAQARREEISDKACHKCTSNKLTGMRRTKYALSGKLFCSECGATYTLGSKNRYNCSEYKHRRCKNGKSILRHTLENHVLDALLDKMLEPERVALFLKECRAHTERIQKRDDEQEAMARSEIGKIDKKLAHFTRAVGEGLDTATIRDEMLKLEKQKKSWMASLRPKRKLSVPDETLIEEYRVLLREFAENLDDDTIRQRAMNVLRPLVDKIILHPADDGLKAELHGKIAGLLSVGRDDDANFFFSAESDIGQRTTVSPSISDSVVIMMNLPFWGRQRKG